MVYSRKSLKRVIINGKTMMNGTSVKGSRETSTNATPTFDGVITQGTRNVSHTLELERVSYEGMVSYMELSDVIEKMIDIPAMVTVEEDIYPSGDEQPFTIIREYHDCVVDGDEYEISPEEHTVESLKFIAARMDKDAKPIQQTGTA